METSWYRRLFFWAPAPNLKATRTEADQGNAEAQFGLGLKYGNSTAPLQDFVRAAEWYRKAAEQNHALAQFNLGIMYTKGQGVPRDDAEGVRWIRKAAEQGDAGAQFNLGMRYHRASVDRTQLDAVESKIEAYKWFRLAAAQDYRDSVTAWQRVTLAMTREEVAEGNRRTATFVAGQPASS
jgi:hypothetical protein